MDDVPSEFAERLIAADVGSWSYDPVADALHADAGFARLLGLSDEDADGGPLSAVFAGVHPDDRERMAAAFASVVRTRRTFAAQFRTVGRDGRTRVVVGRAHVECDERGRAARLPGILIDVTAQRDAEARSAGLAAVADATARRLRASEARLRLALDAAELGTWSIAPDSTLVVDERFALIFAGAPERIDYARAVALVHPEDRARVTEAVARAMRAEDPVPYDEEYRVVHPASGAVRWVQAKGRARVEALDGEAHLAGFDGTLADTTERRRLEDELRQLATDLADADRRKDEFLATLAHELRNPLAPIGNALTIVAHERAARGAASGSSGRARADAALATLERQTAHLARLVDDLMDVSRITRGRVALERRPMPVARVLEAAIEASRPVLDAAGHELVVRMPDEDVVVDADLTRLSQALLNLLNNAAKYSEPGGRVELDARRVGDDVEIAVRDRGVGIAPERLDDVFRMFVQLDGSASRAAGGLGIGLALVERFVALHGGRVEATSDGPGTGSTFRVTLPTLPADAAASAAAAPPSVAARPAVPAARRVLVVDDNEDGANTWVTILGLKGHAARAVHDGFSALAAFEGFAPDTVLLDIGMPGMDGHETCRRLRALPGGGAAHVIAITGWGTPADRERSAAAGIDRHLVKPVRAAELLGLLATLPPARAAGGSGAPAADA